jgi:hypothetical protein
VVKGWSPIDDFAEIEFSNLLEGESALEVTINESLRFWPGALKATVRGAATGAFIGYGLSILTDYPQNQGVQYGSILFAAADIMQYKIRYNWHIMREFFQKR